MAFYEQIVENVELGRNATLVQDIYYILDMEKQLVFKISNKIQTDTSKIDPSNSKASKKIRWKTSSKKV